MFFGTTRCFCCREVVQDFFVPMEAHVREAGGGLGVPGTVGRDNGCFKLYDGQGDIHV